MTKFDDVAWPLIYAVGWIAERDSERAEPYGNLSAPAWRAWRQAQNRAVLLETAFVEPMDKITPAWRDLRDALLNGKITATGRPLKFRTVPENLLSSMGPMAALYTGMQVIGGPIYKQIVDSVGAHESVPALAWVDAASPFTGPANYEAVAILRAGVLRVWPVPQTAAIGPRRRGRQPDVANRVTEAMVCDLRAGKISGNEKPEALKTRYNASINTCKKSMANALSIIQESNY